MRARLHIQVAQRNGIPYLKQSFFTPPFKVANITENKKAAPLHLMLMSSSPGVLDGDEYEMKVELEEGCALHLHTQSYQRLFTMKGGATQTMEVHLKPGASFRYLPHPAVPHEGASFTARNRIYLEEGSSLIWGEVLTCGRKLNGEAFVFTEYRNVTDVYASGKLVIRENLRLLPAFADPLKMGQLEGYSHQASLLYWNEAASIPALADLVHEYLSGQEQMRFGVTHVAPHGMVVRLLGHKAEPLYQYLGAVADLVAR